MDSPREFLFEIKLNVYSREFKGQTSGPKVHEITLNVDNIKDFGEQIWLQVQPLIKREILTQDDGSFVYSDVDPVESDLSR